MICRDCRLNADRQSIIADGAKAVTMVLIPDHCDRDGCTCQHHPVGSVVIDRGEE